MKNPTPSVQAKQKISQRVHQRRRAKKDKRSWWRPPACRTPKRSGALWRSHQACAYSHQQDRQGHALYQEGGYDPATVQQCRCRRFPSPADDHLEGTLDLNEHLIKRPAATFFVRVSGDSMIKAGIHEDDILVVDRKHRATPRQDRHRAVDGQLTCCMHRKSGQTLLMPERRLPADQGQG